MKRSVLAAAVAAFTAVALTACSTGKSLEGGEQAKESAASSKIVEMCIRDRGFPGPYWLPRRARTSFDPRAGGRRKARSGSGTAHGGCSLR